jgi:hypothetical protein
VTCPVGLCCNFGWQHVCNVFRNQRFLYLISHWYIESVLNSLLVVGKGVNLKKKYVYRMWYVCTVRTEVYSFAIVGPFVPSFHLHASKKMSTFIALPIE